MFFCFFRPWMEIFLTRTETGVVLLQPLSLRLLKTYQPLPTTQNLQASQLRSATRYSSILKLICDALLIILPTCNHALSDWKFIAIFYQVLCSERHPLSNYFHSSYMGSWDFFVERLNEYVCDICTQFQFYMSQHKKICTTNTLGIGFGSNFYFSFNVMKRIEGKDGFLFFNLWGTVTAQFCKSFMAVIFLRAVFNCTLSQHSCSNLRLVNLIVEGGFGSDHKDWRCFFLHVCKSAFLISSLLCLHLWSLQGSQVILTTLSYQFGYLCRCWAVTWAVVSPVLSFWFGQGSAAQEPIVRSARSMLDSSTYLLETARSLVLNPKDPPTWSILAGHSRTVSDSIKSLITSIRSVLSSPAATSVPAGLSWIQI